MEFLKNNLRAIVVALLAVGVVIAISTSSENGSDDNGQEQTSEAAENQPEEASDMVSDSDDDSGSEDEATTNQQDQEQAVNKTDSEYSVSAKTGDSQTTLVRRIIAQYSDEQDQTLSAEQQLYVETNIVRNNLETTDFVNQGDVVKVSEDTLKTRFEEAKNLSEATLARWSAYL